MVSWAIHMLLEGFLCHHSLVTSNLRPGFSAVPTLGVALVSSNSAHISLTETDHMASPRTQRGCRIVLLSVPGGERNGLLNSELSMPHAFNGFFWELLRKDWNGGQGGGRKPVEQSPLIVGQTPDSHLWGCFPSCWRFSWPPWLHPPVSVSLHQTSQAQLCVSMSDWITWVSSLRL